MNLSRKILNKPMTILTFFSVLTLAGIFLVSSLALDLFPKVEMPVLAVITTYPMASPTEVEANVTELIEEQLVNVSGLDSLQSYSMDSMSQVVMFFDFNVDIADATAQVRDKLELVKDSLPEDSNSPYIFAVDPNAKPIVDLALVGDQNLEELMDIAEDEVKPQLERITGVAEVSISGGLEEIVKVEIHQDRLDALGLSINQISQALAQQNTSLGAGAIEEGTTQYIIQTSGEFTSLQELEQTVITQRPLSPTSLYEVLLRDVADVSMGAREQDSRVLINGRSGILISVKKTDDANMVAVVDEIKESLEDINSGLPGDLEVTVMNDSSQQVRSTLSQVLSSAYWGILFAVLVLLIFLRRFKSTLIIAISIPVSLMITVGGMSLAGKTLNTMTLTGLVLALGMIVDGSIVILENIFQYRQKGISLRSAAEIGTQEMIGPITGSILTSVSVFLPLLLFKNDLGMVGIMFEDMTFTIILALLTSLAVALLLVPVLTAKVFPIHTRKERPIKNRMLKALDSWIEAGLDGLTRSYKRAVTWCLNRRALVITLAVLLFLGSVAMLPRLGLIMMPPSGESAIILDVNLPEGTALDETEEVMRQWQILIEREIDDLENLTITSGYNGSHGGQAVIALPPQTERQMDDQAIKSTLRQYFEMFPNGEFSFSTTDQARMMSGGSDLSIAVKGYDLEQLIAFSEELKTTIVQQIPQVAELSSSQSNALPQLELELDRQKLYDLGLNTQTIAYELRSQIAGVTATTYSQGNDSFDVVLQLREEDRDSSLDIQKLFVLNPRTGEAIPFGSFGRVVETTGPVRITREDRVRTITLDAELIAGAKPGFVQQEIDQMIQEIMIVPQGITIEEGGQMKMIAETLDSLWIVIVFAAMLVFAVMVSQFESLKSPFIIFMMIPLLLIGVVAVYMIAGLPLSMPSMIGIVMLLGIVVNNGIILVDAINLQRKRGLSVFDAAREASASRLRPVLMTTLTTVLAMVPMAFFPGKGAEMVQPMGMTVIGGLISNTVMTLFLVPVVYLNLFRKEHKNEIAAAQELLKEAV